VSSVATSWGSSGGEDSSRGLHVVTPCSNVSEVLITSIFTLIRKQWVKSLQSHLMLSFPLSCSLPSADPRARWCINMKREIVLSMSLICVDARGGSNSLCFASRLFCMMFCSVTEGNLRTPVSYWSCFILCGWFPLLPILFNGSHSRSVWNPALQSTSGNWRVHIQQNETRAPIWLPLLWVKNNRMSNVSSNSFWAVSMALERVWLRSQLSSLCFK
jgi:hypothetical protein